MKKLVVMAIFGLLLCASTAMAGTITISFAALPTFDSITATITGGTFTFLDPAFTYFDHLDWSQTSISADHKTAQAAGPAVTDFDFLIFDLSFETSFPTDSVFVRIQTFYLGDPAGEETFQITPEPGIATLLLLSLGLIGFGVRRLKP